MLIRLSQLFFRTLREDPVDAEVASHRLLVRAGYIRRAAPGIYTWLPLGLRVLAKVEQVVREEMAAAGAQEVHFPALLPKEPYEATGRWTEYGPNIFRLKDRKGGDYLLAPTHEEMFTLLVKDLYSSYKDLPLTLYQIQTKYRDEARPRAGLIRGREFVMKDAYSFDVDDAGLEASYQAQRDAYQRIFDRLGLEYVIVAATSGAMGGSRSEEFLTPTAIGEDTFVRSPGRLRGERRGGHHRRARRARRSTTPRRRTSRTPRTRRRSTPSCAVANERSRARTGRGPRPTRSRTSCWRSCTRRGERELLVVGLPGDREVDLKRLEAAVAPAEVEAAGDADFASAPGARPRVHRAAGRWARTSRSPTVPSAPRSATCSTRGSSPGTRWITGANEHGQARVRPRRRPRLHRRRHRRGRRGARGRPGARTAPARSSSRAASRSATSSRSAASTPRRSA